MKIPTFLLAALMLPALACSRAPSGDRPKAEYDKVTGRLRRLEFDANKNGRNDSVSYMDGTRVLRVELDLDENGKVERWDFYGADRKLEKVGFASRNDGIMDSVAFYQPEGVLARIEVSTHRDGKFDRIEYYEHGFIARSEQDTNGDGKPDKWETYRMQPNPGPGEPAYAITSTAFDYSGRGTPERRFIYGANGTVARVEVDAKGDGVFVTLNPAPVTLSSHTVRH